MQWEGHPSHDIAEDSPCLRSHYASRLLLLLVYFLRSFTYHSFIFFSIFHISFLFPILLLCVYFVLYICFVLFGFSTFTLFHLSFFMSLVWPLYLFINFLLLPLFTCFLLLSVMASFLFHCLCLFSWYF